MNNFSQCPIELSLVESIFSNSYYLSEKLLAEERIGLLLCEFQLYKLFVHRQIHTN